MDPDYAGHALDTFNDLADPATVTALCQALRLARRELLALRDTAGLHPDSGSLLHVDYALDCLDALVDFGAPQPPDPEEPA